MGDIEKKLEHDWTKKMIAFIAPPEYASKFGTAQLNNDLDTLATFFPSPEQTFPFDPIVVFEKSKFGVANEFCQPISTFFNTPQALSLQKDFCCNPFTRK